MNGIISILTGNPIVDFVMGFVSVVFIFTAIFFWR